MMTDLQTQVVKKLIKDTEKPLWLINSSITQLLINNYINQKNWSLESNPAGEVILHVKILPKDSMINQQRFVILRIGYRIKKEPFGMTNKTRSLICKKIAILKSKNLTVQKI